VVVFVNPTGVAPQLLSMSIRRFLVQALLVWEGYPLSGLKASTADAATVGPMQQWLHTSLLALATDHRFSELTGSPPEPRRFSRLPPFTVPSEIRQKLVAFESALGRNEQPTELASDARAIADVLNRHDVRTAAGFRAAFGGILELWDMRGPVIIGVADKTSGAISETAW